MGPGIHGGGGGQITSLVITLLIVMVVLMMRNRRPRRLRLQAMWIRPLIFIALIVASALAAPPSLGAVSLTAMSLAVAIGAALGWQRGRFMRIEVHPETHDITARASPVGVLFILAVIAARVGLRDFAYESRGIGGLSTATITYALILLVGAMMIVQSVEMWFRARRLLADAQGASVSPIVSPGANPPIVS